MLKRAMSVFELSCINVTVDVANRELYRTTGKCKEI
jgi:hypothetical protein